MHKLDRSLVPKPVCLAGFDYRTQTWDDFKGPCRKLVRLTLQAMQGQQVIDDSAEDAQAFILGLRCAYCESQIYFGGHIEHYRRKNRIRPDGYPELTFEWTNLFLACDSKDHCGHYKDRPTALPYNPDELIKPDEHDPDDYLCFHSTGEVRVRDRDTMSTQDRNRGSETIRVFHLNCGPLRGARHKAIRRYLDRNVGILDLLMECEDADRFRFIDEEFEATRWEPHWTTIRHFFERQN